MWISSLNAYTKIINSLRSNSMIFTDNTIYSHLRTVKFPAEGLLYHIISTGVLRFSCNYLDGKRLSEAMPGMTLAAVLSAAANPPKSMLHQKQEIYVLRILRAWDTSWIYLTGRNIRCREKWHCLSVSELCHFSWRF